MALRLEDYELCLSERWGHTKHLLEWGIEEENRMEFINWLENFCEKYSLFSTRIKHDIEHYLVRFSINSITDEVKPNTSSANEFLSKLWNSLCRNEIKLIYDFLLKSVSFLLSSWEKPTISEKTEVEYYFPEAVPRVMKILEEHGKKFR